MTATERVALRRLTIEFLRELAKRFGRDGCNDWDWPEWVPVSLRRKLSLFEADDADCVRWRLENGMANFVAAYALADLIEKETPS